MIVVDVGCYSHPAHQGESQDSAALLVERFRPRLYFGFDPHPGQAEGIDTVGPNDDTVRVFRRAAAWVYNGRAGFVEDGLASRIGDRLPEYPLVQCFDLVSWMLALPFENEEVVLKLDVEGSEYDLLPRLTEFGLDEFLKVLLVEWHDLPARALERHRFLERLRCPVGDWA